MRVAPLELQAELEIIQAVRINGAFMLDLVMRDESAQRPI